MQKKRNKRENTDLLGRRIVASTSSHARYNARRKQHAYYVSHCVDVYSTHVTMLSIQVKFICFRALAPGLLGTRNFLTIPTRDLKLYQRRHKDVLLIYTPTVYYVLRTSKYNLTVGEQITSCSSRKRSLHGQPRFPLRRPSASRDVLSRFFIRRCCVVGEFDAQRSRNSFCGKIS